ncbi:MAG: metal ABC transporter substrate-binding protein [Eubacteriales bacterium]|nr:metal ABC transporter substrate-binding protein [Eubacteriales bacterium]
MKRLLCGLLSAVLLLSLCGCTSAYQESDKLQVVCTLFPYYDFARVIGGNGVDVTLLAAPGKETHSFEPTPLDMVRVSKADVFLYNGGESEQWVDDILSSAGKDIPVTAAMMELVELEREEIVEGMQVGESHEDEDSDEIEYDEHIWTSPVLAQSICWGICGALCKADWEHAEDYVARTDAYVAQLGELDAAFRKVVENGQRDTLVFGDRFPLLYFCKTYDLNYRAAFHGCAGDTEPSLATLKFLIDKVNDEQIPVVYTIELSSQKVAQAIAETTGAKVVTFHSCQQVSRKDFDNGVTYLDLMWGNVDALKEGLS